MSGGSFALSYVNNTKAYRDLDNSYHPGAKIYSVSNSFPLTARSRLSISGKWDQARTEFDNRFKESSTKKINRTLTGLVISYVYNHQCYNLSFSYGEKIKTDPEIFEEYLAKKLKFTLSIPLVPNARVPGVGEIAIKDVVSFR